MEQIQEAAGTPPEWVRNPTKNDDFDINRSEKDYVRHALSRDSAAISARFFRAPDPRPDFVGNTIINEQGEVPVIEMVEIFNRNDIKNSPSINIATDHHRYKSRAEGGFPEEYRNFRMGVEREAAGYPIREWLGENDRAKNLGSFEIYTVEQLAAASDSLCQTLGPGTYDLRQRAKVFLLNRQNSGAAEQAIVENQRLNRELEELKATVAMLAQQSGAQAARPAPETVQEHPAEQITPTPERRGPGRPRVNQEN